MGQSIFDISHFLLEISYKFALSPFILFILFLASNLSSFHILHPS
jgi:hypothetical protein